VLIAAFVVGLAVGRAGGRPEAAPAGQEGGPAVPAGAGVALAAVGQGRIHVVRQGETLWSIARSLAPWRDPRAVVVELEAANGVDAGSLRPGQPLVIPAGIAG
jgi:hypothetical protein